jgi:hypothetical protein
MKTILNSLLLFSFLALLLAACGGSDVPALAVTGEPTLVYIYTDG